MNEPNSNFPDDIDPGDSVEHRDEANMFKWELWVRAELDKERESAELSGEMVAAGWEANEAIELVGRMRQQQLIDFQDAAAEREEWRVIVGKYRRTTILGGLYFTAGILVTIRSYLRPGSVGWLATLIASGAAAFGMLRFVYGLLGYLRPMSTRLSGQHIPGRRIGAYAPGSPRTRYSRFS